MYKEDANRPRSGTFQERGTNYDTKQFQRFRAKQNDLTASRAINSTVYQNTSGKVLNVQISTYTSLAANTFSVGTATVYCDAAASPTTAKGTLGATATLPASTTMTIYSSVSFIVPIGHYYKVVPATANGGAITKQYWFEDYLF